MTVPHYFPIEPPVDIKASASDLRELHWKDGGLIADFVIPEDETHDLRVQFAQAEIVRVLDEMPLSTESEETPKMGLAPDHFAYRVEGALFWKSQSEAFKAALPNALHYRFITGSTCIDVVSVAGPILAVVPRESR